MRNVANHLEIARPEFNLKLGVAETYDALLGRSYSSIVSANELLSTAQETGRLLVHGYAGSGKTQLLHRLYRHIVADGKFAVLIRLRDLVAEEKGWNDVPDNLRSQSQMLLARAEPPTDETSVRSIPSTLFALVDGLDEVPSELAVSVLGALDALAQRLPNLVVIVTDRFSVRPVSPETWRLASILPLGENDLPPLPQRNQDVNQRLLTIPLFVDLLAKGEVSLSQLRAPQVSIAAILNDLIERSIPADEVGRVSHAAYSTFADARSRVFAINWLTEAAGAAAVDRLMQKGLLKVEGERASFTQNLVHDYLAARYFASNPSLWNQRGFDVVSFTGASFDVLVLAAEVLATGSDEGLSERFIHQLYDWNFYAVGFVLARSIAVGSHVISRDTTLAAEAMMTERKWDRIVSTRTRVIAALRIIGDRNSSELLSLKDFSQLREWVAAREGSTSWFAAWRKLFLVPHGTSVDVDFVNAIEDPESILGWTAANVVKRTAPSIEALNRLREMLSVGTDTVRWRVAHALGAFPSRENFHPLVQMLGSDPYPWARYGALRSLVEQASLTDAGPLREEIIQGLADNVGVILSDQRLRIELERCLEVDPIPDGWARSLDPLISALWDRTSGELQFLWERLASKLSEKERAALV